MLGASPPQTRPPSTRTLGPLFNLEFSSGEEFAMRLEVLAASDGAITLGHNAHSHLAWAEFRTQLHLGQPYEPKKHGFKVHKASASWWWTASTGRWRKR